MSNNDEENNEGQLESTEEENEESGTSADQVIN